MATHESHHVVGVDSPVSQSCHIRVYYRHRTGVVVTFVSCSCSFSCLLRIRVSVMYVVVPVSSSPSCHVRDCARVYFTFVSASGMWSHRCRGRNRVMFVFSCLFRIPVAFLSSVSCSVFVCCPFGPLLSRNCKLNPSNLPFRRCSHPSDLTPRALSLKVYQT